MRIPRNPVPALVLVLALTALACGREGTDREDTATATDDLRVEEVRLGRAVDTARRITDESDRFRPEETIYVSVQTDGTDPDARLTARWRFEDGQIVDERTETLAASGPTTTEFHISKPDGFPAGKYEVEILVDDRSVEKKEFHIQ